MAPLVPDIISNEFNFFIALIVGVGFGFALEQAGFSSTKKLVGLFYGYDFTVLKVFFTAGVTAMTGVVLLGHLGILNLEMLYINPTFLPSAIVGGVIMGAGFVIGGFCPGTSVCAAAVGKLDGLAFIGGSILGIFAFMEFYPMLKPLYMSSPEGGLLIFEQMGVSRNVFAIILISIALIAFFAVTLIENAVNNKKTIYPARVVRKNMLLAAIPFVIVLFVFITPDTEQRIVNKIEKARREGKCEVRLIDADKVASEMVQQYFKYYLIDVRSPEEYKKSHIPLAINVPVDSIRNEEFRNYFTQHHRKVVFYSDDDTTARKACLISRFLGSSDNYVMREEFTEFTRLFPKNQGEDFAIPDNVNKEVFMFRLSASKKLYDLEEALKHQSAPVKKKKTKIQGGCS